MAQGLEGQEHYIRNCNQDVARDLYEIRDTRKDCDREWSPAHEFVVQDVLPGERNQGDMQYAVSSADEWSRRAFHRDFKETRNKSARSMFGDRITATSKCPSELLMGRRLTTRLDNLRPSVERYVDDKVEEQRDRHET
ncbi:hypothetical protein ACOME3_003578 [Neoechinorhynchus agilis]